MDTLALRIAAASAQLVEDFEPSGFAPLSDPRGPRLLLSDGQRSVVAALLGPAQALEAAAEQVAAAVLRAILPDSPVAFPTVLARQPMPRGFVPDEEVVLQVSEPLPGAPVSTLDFRESALAPSLARFLAALHSADAGGVADAGLVAQESQEIREALLGELDRGAETGEVPGGLLGRWEEALETVSLWRFLPAPVHGDLSLEALRAQDGELSAVSELARLRVGDPAADLAAVSGLLDPDDFDAFLAAYAAARPAEDAGLSERIDFMSEFAVLQWFLAAVDAGDAEARAEAVALLWQLAELTGGTAASGAPARAGAAGAAEAAEAERTSDEHPSAEPSTADDPGAAAAGAPSASGASAAGADGRIDGTGRGAEDGRDGHGESPARTGAEPAAPHVTEDIDRDRAAFRPAAPVRPARAGRQEAGGSHAAGHGAAAPGTSPQGASPQGTAAQGTAGRGGIPEDPAEAETGRIAGPDELERIGSPTDSADSGDPGDARTRSSLVDTQRTELGEDFAAGDDTAPVERP